MTVIVSFIVFLAFAGALTWFIVRKQDVGSNTGFFLAGRSLTFPLIAASLLLTNLSTEQMVGLNGSAFRQGLCVMAWEVVAVVSLVAMAWFFLPKFLKSGVTTVPEYLELRFGKSTGTIANAIFLFFYVFLLLPLILYTGALALSRILDFHSLLPGLSDTAILWLAIWLIGLMGCAYSLFGGLRTCAVLDTINGIGLLVGGFMIVFFALNKVSAVNGGELGIMGALSEVRNAHAEAEMFNTFGRPKSEVPFWTLFTGVLIINMFYWCTNQQIIQRTFGAKGLAEGQKGVLLCGLLKLLGPLYLVLPGMIAFYFACKGLLNLDMNSSALAYGELVTFVLPNWLAGFFAAVLIGAVLSSFNGALNSSCTLFSIGFYKGIINPQAEDKKVVLSGRVFGFIIAVLCMCGAPLLANTSSIFDYLQKTNGIYNIPLFAIILVGMLTKFVPKMAANVALFVGVVLIAFLTFGDTFFGEGFIDKITGGLNIYHVDTIVFLILIAIMGIWSLVAPRKEAFVQQDVKAVDMTPWKLSWVAGGLLFVLVGIIYIAFGKLGALKDDKAPVPYHWDLIATDIANKEMKALGIAQDEQGVILVEIRKSLADFDMARNGELKPILLDADEKKDIAEAMKKDNASDEEIQAAIAAQELTQEEIDDLVALLGKLTIDKKAQEKYENALAQGKQVKAPPRIKAPDTAVTRVIVYKTIGKHYAKAKGFPEAQIAAFNELVEEKATVSAKEADDLKATTAPAIEKFFSDAIEELKKGVKGAKDAADTAKKDAEDAAEAAKKDGESVIDSVNKGVEGVTTGVGESLEGAVNSVSKGVEGVASGISETFKNL